MKNQKVKNFSHSFLLKLTGCFSLFFVFLFLSFFLLYLFGNFQNFTDESQNLIVYLCSIISLVSFLFSIAGILESVIFFIITKLKRMWIYFTLFFLLLLLSSADYIILRIIIHLSEGL